MNSLIAVTSLFLLVFVSTAASAQTPAEEIRGRVKEGQKVVITDAQGREVSGRVSQMTDSFLTVRQKDHPVDIFYTDVIAIDRPRDRLGNGALFGLAVGAASAPPWWLRAYPRKARVLTVGWEFLTIVVNLMSPRQSS